MTIHILLTLANKKGTFTYSYSNPGIGRNQMMCCCWSQIASDYMKFSFNPLRLVYVPAPSPPPLSRQLRPSFSYPALSLPVSTLTRGIQGCPKTISLDKNIWHSSFLKIFPNLLFFCRFAPVHFCNTFCQKMLSFFPPLNNPRIFPDFSFITAFFTLA